MTISWVPTFDNQSGTLARKIVKALQDEIDSGKLGNGFRLPSQRELAYELKIAIGTVSRAYQMAEDKGLIYSDGRRGTFVGSSPVDKSGLGDLVNERGSFINLGQCMPTITLDPDLGRALKSIVRNSRHIDLMQYGTYGGSDRFRRSGSTWFKKMGLVVDPSEVILTCGAQHALSIVLPLIAKSKEAIAVESVTYPGVKSISDLYGFGLVGIEYDEEGMLPDALERVMKKRRISAIYLMPTLQNPTGAVMSLQRRKQFADLADAHDLYIIEDDIHRMFVEDPPPLFAQLIPERTVSVASLSKVLAGGLRLAFLVAPEAIKNDLKMAMQTSIVTPPQLLSEIFATWLEDGVVDETIKLRQEQIRKRQALAQKHFSEFNFSSHPNNPCIWVELKDSWTPQEFAMQALREGVAVNSPDAFVVRPGPIPNRIRVCLGVPETIDKLNDGLKILSELLSKTPNLAAASM